MTIYELLRILANDIKASDAKLDAAELIDNLERANAFGTVASQGTKHECDYQPKSIPKEDTYSPFRGVKYKPIQYRIVYRCIYCGKDDKGL
jgi:hypothetical protein